MIKPTPEEVTEYARKVGFILDGNHFCDFYECKGWYVGKNPMKVWQAAVRTWKHKEVMNPKKGSRIESQTPADPTKVAEAKQRMEDRRQREWDRRESERLKKIEFVKEQLNDVFDKSMRELERIYCDNIP